MRAKIGPGSHLAGVAEIPGDKSIAHRWIIFAATAEGRCTLRGLPAAGDVRSTASCMARLTGEEEGPFSGFAEAPPGEGEGQGLTWNKQHPWNYSAEVQLEGKGLKGLRAAPDGLWCANSGSSMRLLTGLVAPTHFTTVLTGDEALSGRPMERLADPLRRMGARIQTTDGHAPVTVTGSSLEGTAHRMETPSAQVKSAILLAGLQAAGTTSVTEPVTTRDHTERLLEALGAPVRIDGRTVSVSAFQHGGFEGTVPADPSSASFLLAAAAITGSALRIVGVGLNPSRLAFLDVMRRLGAEIDQTATGSEMGEPVGDLAIAEGTNLTGTAVEAIDIPLVIDEVPVLAAMASHAEGQTRFLSAGELRVKESDRLEGTAAGLTELGGTASVEGNDLIIGGGGLAGGEADARRDHRLAMAFCVAALGARGTSAVDGMEWAAVTFPGFERSLAELGANLEIA